jgi:hypothetical protein
MKEPPKISRQSAAGPAAFGIGVSGETAVVRRVFEDYARGQGFKMLAHKHPLRDTRWSAREPLRYRDDPGADSSGG